MLIVSVITHRDKYRSTALLSTFENNSNKKQIKLTLDNNMCTKTSGEILWQKILHQSPFYHMLNKGCECNKHI